MISISELITILNSVRTMYGDLPVVMSQDPEGNGFSPYSDLCVGMYAQEDGEFTDMDSIDQNPEEFDYLDEDAEKAVCLWPMY